MQTPFDSRALVLLACLGVLPLAIRRRAKAAATPRPGLAIATSVAPAAAGLAKALH